MSVKVWVADVTDISRMLRFTQLYQATSSKGGVIRTPQLAPGLCGTCVEGLVNFEKAVCTHLKDWLRRRSDLGLVATLG